MPFPVSVPLPLTKTFASGVNVELELTERVPEALKFRLEETPEVLLIVKLLKVIIEPVLPLIEVAAGTLGVANVTVVELDE